MSYSRYFIIIISLLSVWLVHPVWADVLTKKVEIKHIDLDESMIRAIAKQAEAERERRAKVIHAEGELEASEKLLGAANVIAENPQALQLRYLQTLSNISTENTSTIIFPLPLDMFKVFEKHMSCQNKGD